MMQGVSRQLAEHVASARFEDLPAAAVTAAKRSLLDAVGVMLAASGLGEGCDAFIELSPTGGGGRCTLLGYGERAGLLGAALANGALAHALDYEDALDGAPIHPNAALIPAALALAQQTGGVSGRRFLTALAVGCDLVCRLGLALRRNPDDLGWYPPPILGAQGAAAACAVLLGLDAAQTVDAFALTLGPSGQSSEFKRTPASTLRAVRDAFAAHAGVVGARLASRGVRGFHAPFEGEAGLFALFAGGAYDAETLTERLGERFFGTQVSYKPWPSCRGTHAAIEAALRLREQGVRAQDVRSILVTGGPVQRMLAEPPAQKRAPQTAIDGKFSLPFTVAAALVHGKVTLDSFSPAALADAAILELAAQVQFRVVEDMGMTSGALEVDLADGRRLIVEVEHPLGHPSKPISEPALLAKFRDCAARARRPLPAEAIEALAATILRLETVEDLDAAFFPRLG